ncbi:MAG: hypothetical protein M3362_09400 [Acidobacteriota bacterium]|nr:hypothetical protein [Acidobacteriota bacterium]
MGLMDQLGGLLQQYAGAQAAEAPATVHDDFDQVAEQAPQSNLADGLSAAFRSDQTPPFGQMVGHLFGNASGQQRAGIQEIAAQAEKQNPSVVDQISGFYAQHPKLVKTLGAAALTLVLARIAQREYS